MANTIWVLVELEQGQPARSSLEVLGKAAQLGRAEAIVLGSAAATVAPTLGEYGADKVYVHADAIYDQYLTLPAVDTISELLKQHQPRLLMLAYTYELRDLAARLNVRHNMGLITDAADLHFEGETLQVTVPWGGQNVVTVTLPSAGTGIVLTLPKAFAVEHHAGKAAEIETLNITLRAEAQKMKIVDRIELPIEGPSLEDASVIVVFAFLSYLPRSKHLHLMATPFNVFFENYAPKGALPLMENLEEREDYGVSKPEQFTWKQLLDGYACTECGRCNIVCPASNTGKPLFPKEIILGVKEALFVQSREILGENTLWSKIGVAGLPADETAEEKKAHHEPMVGGIISTDALWACTTCQACMEICPVAIEHVPKIVDMRRHLVMEESDFPQEVTSLFNNIERNFNPWEINNDTRAAWASGLGVPLMSENPDAEVLYWVGCMGSFDQRNKQVATAVAKILKAAEVNFAILGPEEWCTGDPARRIGNEYLWQMMAQQNIETLNSYGFNTTVDHSNGHASASAVAGVAIKPRTIITACPHCFNTIKNEYPQLGGTYEVVHHTVFIDRLLAEKKIALPSGFDRRKLTYHDPCYIGRYNDVYDEPRHVLTVLNSNGVTEMRRNRNKSFCCGGGGGRAWMEEKIGKRVNQARISEALDTGAEVLAAACPFCITMFDDGIKGVEAEDKMQIEDIAEIVAQAIEVQKAHIQKS